MPLPLPPLRLTGADILRDGEMQRRSVCIADGRIARGPLPEVDLTGYLILPGIVDLHGDGFERHLFPRPGVDFPLAAGLASTDREAAAHGVTTAWLAQGWSWEGGSRSPEGAEALLSALAAFRPRALTDLRVQLRAEIHLVEAGARLIAAVARHRVGYVVFNDHLEQGHEMRRLRPDAFAHWSRRNGRTPEQMLAAIEAAEARSREVPRHLCRLADAFDEMGVLYGSHDDPDGETRERYSMIGARIAEFPTTRRAAAAARAMMSPVIMGAPNVVRGGSQSGNVSACDLIAEGLCDALVSDYHVPALALAAWTLVDRGMMALPQAWAMISTRPAEIMRLADRGRIEPGLRADLTVVNAETRMVEATIAAGRLSWLSGEAARRFLAQPQAMRMAAE
ncbi:MAG: alpha-D-ribose 1-methylphosphonate 5-triphosphate diphosphatase [Paracoccaceae bacterium]|nr:MAG: alpha-D-ribose 1-methylphosphonate 5-triphosphate diphosphatase [Paracoccaceae bacterium]